MSLSSSFSTSNLIYLTDLTQFNSLFKSRSQLLYHTKSVLSQDMFPDVDRVVLRTVLEGKHGNMEGAISALLQMTEDMEQATVPASLQPAPASTWSYLF